jgi:arylsulfatase A-like enzyme
MESATAMTNVLVFMTDQQRGTTVYGEHNARARTPRLDRFRQDAATFTQAFAPSPHFPSEHGVWNNVNVPKCAVARTA